jgi:hypothetical protein
LFDAQNAIGGHAELLYNVPQPKARDAPSAVKD